MNAGQFFHFVAFDERGTGDDGAGGVHGPWEERFCMRAKYQHLRGGESVQAARLEGKHPQIITIRSSQAANRVSTDWRIRDRHTGESFNILDVAPTEDRKYLEFYCQSGTADG